MKRQSLEKEGEERAMRKRGEKKEEEVVDLALLRNVVRLGGTFSGAR